MRGSMAAACYACATRPVGRLLLVAWLLASSWTGLKTLVFCFLLVSIIIHVSAMMWWHCISNMIIDWFNSKYILDLCWDILWDNCRVEGPGGREKPPTIPNPIINCKWGIHTLEICCTPRFSLQIDDKAAPPTAGQRKRRGDSDESRMKDGRGLTSWWQWINIQGPNFM